MRCIQIAGFVLLTFIFCSCGYRFSTCQNGFETISIPYVQGDDHGFLTSSLIEKISTKSRYKYTVTGGDASLCVCLMKPTTENIGFILVPTDDGSDSQTVAAEEARTSIVAKVQVTDKSGRCLVGPAFIKASMTFDFEPDLSNINYHQFALGQLEMENLAEDAAFRPLYIHLAEKIVDYVTFCW